MCDGHMYFVGGGTDLSLKEIQRHPHVRSVTTELPCVHIEEKLFVLPTDQVFTFVVQLHSGHFKFADINTYYQVYHQHSNSPLKRFS